jgi:phenylpropionate dioxygenase-like ring-hydroxylating dioxygenase large terminal subunit
MIYHHASGNAQYSFGRAVVASAEENELLTRTGPGTPAGELLRRYWQPVALSEELLIGGAPLPVRIMSEDLVLFRDDAGQPGLLGIHCAHRGADLSYGRLEDGGLRCIYHGWLYDRTGRCLEQPGEPAGSTFHERIHHRAYPCQEIGGYIFTYMGPSEPPLLPRFEFLITDADHNFAAKRLNECNFLQGLEGTYDPQHLGFLHLIYSAPDDPVQGYLAADPSPSIEVEERENGVCVMRRLRISEDQYFVKSNKYVVPNMSVAAATVSGYTFHWYVPIDDESCFIYDAVFSRDVPLDRERLLRSRSERDGNYRLLRNRDNRYLQDREEMRTRTFSGIGTSFNAQDACVIEGAGRIQDRTQEHLGYTDKGIVAARAVYLRAIREVQSGRDAPTVVRDPALNRSPNTTVVDAVIPAVPDWSERLRARELELAGASPAAAV